MTPFVKEGKNWNTGVGSYLYIHRKCYQLTYTCTYLFLTDHIKSKKIEVIKQIVYCDLLASIINIIQNSKVHNIYSPEAQQCNIQWKSSLLTTYTFILSS